MRRHGCRTHRSCVELFRFVDRVQVCGINRGHSAGRLSLQGDQGLVISTLQAVAISVVAICAISRASLATRPDMQKAIHRSIKPDDLLKTYSELAVKEPDLVLQASVAAMVNVQSVEAVEGEMKRRAVVGPYPIDVVSSLMV